MRATNVFFSAVQFFILIGLCFFGILCLTLAYAVELRFRLAQFVWDHSTGFALIGYVVLVCSFLLFAGFYFMNKGTYYQIKMGEVDPQVIRAYVKTYWDSLFPEQQMKADVVIHRNQTIEVVAEMEPLIGQEKQMLLSQIEKQLGELLFRSLGYHREFFVTAVVRKSRDGQA